MVNEFEEIAKEVNKIVKEDENLELCPICKGTTFVPVFLGVTLCAYCMGRGFIKKEK